jgi:hypothetical protein
MKYVYEDLSDDQFEKLVIFICQKLLGISVQGFSKGPDGGRDAKFVGTAELHPSKAAPWVGTVIVQAKHTNGYNRLFSESDFYSEATEKSVLSEEIPRIKGLKTRGQLDHYMLFSNRRLAGNAESEIRSYISRESGIAEASIYLCGVEQMEILLKSFPDIPGKAKLDPVDSPLIVSPDDLADVVAALARHRAGLQDAVDHPPTPRVSYERKNALNNMTAEYAKLQRRNYLKDTAQIQAFLAAPENAEVLEQYESVVDEFQAKIVAHRKDYQTFDLVMEYLIDLLFSRDALLRQQGHKRLTRTMLFYMYWHCDIGKDGDDAAT